MRVPEIHHTLLTVTSPDSPLLEPGDHALLVLLADDDDRKEAVWVEVLAHLQDGVHRGQLLRDPALFGELSAGEYLYFRPEHVLKLRLAGLVGTPTALA